MLEKNPLRCVMNYYTKITNLFRFMRKRQVKANLFMMVLTIGVGFGFSYQPESAFAVDDCPYTSCLPTNPNPGACVSMPDTDNICDGQDFFWCCIEPIDDIIPPPPPLPRPPLPSGAGCRWETSGNNARFCSYGWESREALVGDGSRDQPGTGFRLACRENCATNPVLDFLARIRLRETWDVTNEMVFEENDGTWAACTSYIDTGDGFLDSYYSSCMESRLLERGISNPVCLGAITAGVTASIIFPPGGILAVVKGSSVVGGACAGVAIYDLLDAHSRCLPSFEITHARKTCGVAGCVLDIIDSCSRNLTFDIDLQLVDVEDEEETQESETISFQLCSQIDPSLTDHLGRNLRNECIDCLEGDEEGVDGVWTAVGCISREPVNIVQILMRIGIMTGGGIGLLMLLAASFILTISQGDPKRTSEARDMIIAAIVGLLFIIFSVVLLEFVGYSVLRIPGFGGG